MERINLQFVFTGTEFFIGSELFLPLVMRFLLNAILFTLEVILKVLLHTYVRRLRPRAKNGKRSLPDIVNQASLASQ